MKRQRLMGALLALNVAVLVAVLLSMRSGESRSDPAVLRGQGLELTDSGGRVRVRLNVEENGAVMLRMFDERGTIRVKLGADADGSGLVLMDDATAPGVHLLAKPTGPSVTLTGKDGRQTALSP